MLAVLWLVLVVVALFGLLVWSDRDSKRQIAEARAKDEERWG